MTRRPVQFGLGDLETRLAGVMNAPEQAVEPDSPPLSGITFVHTGEVAVARSNATFSTVLGSCVSICVWDPKTGAGGMNHFLLPDQVSNGMSSSRFGNVAVRNLLSKLDAFGIPAQSLQAKIFGGASVLGGGVVPRDNLGGRNVELARVLLSLAGIPVVAEDVGGINGRKLVFRTSDGAAWVRRL